VAGVNFKPPAQSRCFGNECKVVAEDLAMAFNTPSHHPPSPPVKVFPSTLSRGIAHDHRHPLTLAEVDGNVDNPGSDGAISDDSAGEEDNASEFVAVDLDSEADGMTNATLSPGRHVRDRSEVDNQQRKSNVEEVPWQRQL
jgi:hypothetical protein